MEESVRVGQAILIKGEEYVVESIYKREHTRKIHVGSADARKQAKAICHFLRDMDCDEFNEGDVVHESMEEVRLLRTHDNSPLIIHNYHNFKKETHGTENRIEDDSVRPTGDEGFRATSTGEVG